jgi:hypothetical protein
MLKFTKLLNTNKKRPNLKGSILMKENLVYHTTKFCANHEYYFQTYACH